MAKSNLFIQLHTLQYKAWGTELGGDLFGSGATHSYFAKLPLRPFFFIVVIVDILGACHQILYVLH